jgi:hypothetical protein
MRSLPTLSFHCIFVLLKQNKNFKIKKDGKSNKIPNSKKRGIGTWRIR